ncbi:2-iminobutanoate/2-iminopropanoate deaminase [Nonlabens dokdonensis]|jgi:2-iminobutanoate/2-iminopropanoate deaminase|uniref:Translation initiation inhibitor n=2 Tax=Nonlabens dokdonensis TaxID=328515 RepID=L7WEQ2_NONDD|nr:Rid family detoxifying hydrolase [Nonlabens dokdonensis]AGC78406.1 translation initiation inhibitor [Nonlabens dokdonensis DSW-6]PZX38154.1 2-iminobutanoate/2-iminopropanoate deaminase [Nonlabens dokdonensis]
MKRIIYTDLAPKPIGPYNQAVYYKNDYEATLYTSGQIAMDPQTGELKIEDLKEETHLVMKHLNSLLSQVGMTFEHVLKTTIFLSDMNNFSIVNEVYGSYFNESTAPARETVEVANLPKYVNVEISLIAKLEL